MSRRRIALIFDNTLRPETTGTYCLRALRKYVDVEFFTPDRLEQIPRTGFDLYLNIDDGLRYRLPSDLRPCAWWVIDTHMDLPWAIKKGRDFEWLFAAQRDGAKQLVAAGCPAVWLPLACDPEIHRPWPVKNKWDVCFVGRVSPGPRQELLQLIVDQFPRSFIGQSYFDEYAQTLSASHIGFNRSVKNDVNMRVFETLGCGSLLITNNLTDNGQRDLFEPDRDLVTYESADELLDKVRFYLRFESHRHRIAQAGHANVSERHTYRHRMGELLKNVQFDLNRVSVSVDIAPTDLQSEVHHNWIDSIDFVIKTFLRPKALMRLLQSIREHYPSARVTVADDGNLRSGRDAASIACCNLLDGRPEIQLLELPFGSGVTSGRNQLVEQTRRPFLLYLDDDFAFTKSTDIKRLWDRLQNDPGLGVVAGACIDVVNGSRQLRNSGGVFSLADDVLEIQTQEWRDQDEGLREYVPQFMLIRRDVFEDIQWDGGIGGEHYDFCLQLMRSRWKVAHDMSVVIDHYPLSETLPDYESYRFDCVGAQQWLLRKWGLQKIVQDGTTIVERIRGFAEPSTVPMQSITGRPQKDAPYFGFARPEVVALIPTMAKQVLDIGCGAGRLGQLLKQRQNADVTGVELHPLAANMARETLDDVLERNVEDPSFEFEEGRFDCIVCADVLEHLREPADVLAKIRRWLTPDGSLVISLPNVRHHSVVSGLLEGNWTYEAAGLLDNDHVRFFSRREIEKLLFRKGFEIASLIPKPGPGHAEWVAAGRPGRVRAGSLNIEGLTPENAEEFFTYQYLIVARPLQPLRHHQANRKPFEDALGQLRTRFPWPVRKPDVAIPKENLGWCSEATRSVLEQELTTSKSLIVELGAWLGLSTRFIADRVPQAHVITIDHWEGSSEHQSRSDWAALLPTLYETFQSLTWDYRERVTPLRMTTLAGLQTIADLGLNPDLIFVDADHSYAAVSAELDLCNRLFPGATLVGDDYDYPDVQRAVNEFASRIGGRIAPVGSGWRSWRLDRQESVSQPTSQDFGLTSIIIVTFNELGYTKECVDSIRLRSDEPYELIFVDNGSTDGTPQYLESLADVQVIRNSGNRGFPAAVNQGIKLAHGKQILLLNNDTVVSTGWLLKMLIALESNSRVGLVGPCSNNVSGSQMIPAAYTEMTSMDGFAWEWGKQHAGQREETDRLIGFCLLIKKAVIDQIGGLDEQFGIGCFEDDDICLRAKQAGWSAVIAREAFVHHYGSRTFAASGVDFDALMNQNRRKFHDKWNNPPHRSAEVPNKKTFGLMEAPGGGLLLTTTQPRLSLCMIVRNNETTIRPCLESIRPWVDEMIVVDTGSTDATPRICEELGAKVFHWPWCDDFSAARNQSLMHATGEWLFWMDSDDEIYENCGRQLRQLADGTHNPEILGYVVPVHCPGPDSDGPYDVTVVDHVKLIRNRPDLRFEFRIHEQILPAIRRAGGDVAFTDIFVVHSGSDRSATGREQKLQRDFKLLFLDLKDRPDHPFVLFNLGMTYADTDQHADAVHWLKRCLQVSSPQESHVRKAYALLVSVLYKQSRFDEALVACQEGRRIYPADKELLFRQAMLHHQVGKLDDAVSDYIAVLTPSVERHFSSVDMGLTGFKSRHNLALVYEDQGRTKFAEREWTTILDERPTYYPAEIGLIECLLKQNEFEKADTLIRRMENRPECQVEVHRLAARLIELQGNYFPALQRLQQGINQIGKDPILLREQARLFYLTKDLRSAAEILQYLKMVLPHDQQIINNLHVVMSELGQSYGS